MENTPFHLWVIMYTYVLRGFFLVKWVVSWVASSSPRNLLELQISGHIPELLHQKYLTSSVGDSDACWIHWPKLSYVTSILAMYVDFYPVRTIILSSNNVQSEVNIRQSIGVWEKNTGIFVYFFVLFYIFVYNNIWNI